jgi:4'-phosphopantetheinyl transferase EntD
MGAPLFPVEILAMVGVHPRRQMTFRSGRACARAALRKLGVPTLAIQIGASGAPIWPEGVVGSISHTDELAAAIVARQPRVRGLGLDLEADDPLDDAMMVQLVCRPEELASGDPSHPANLRRGKFLFTIKQAVYKLYEPLTGTFLDFHDVHVTLDENSGTFRADLADPRLPPVGGARTVAGCLSMAEGFVIAVAMQGASG